MAPTARADPLTKSTRAFYSHIGTGILLAVALDHRIRLVVFVAVLDGIAPFPDPDDAGLKRQEDMGQSTNDGAGGIIGWATPAMALAGTIGPSSAFSRSSSMSRIRGALRTSGVRDRFGGGRSVLGCGPSGPVRARCSRGRPLVIPSRVCLVARAGETQVVWAPER